MTDDDIALVREGWAQIVPVADAAMTQFYSRLFEADARVAELFAGKDIAAQRSRLAGAITLVVSKLHQPEALAQPLQDLGARHAGYDVAERDFDLVGDALLTTLAGGLAEHWTSAQQKAWAGAWAIIKSHVLIGFRAQGAA